MKKILLFIIFVSSVFTFAETESQENVSENKIEFIKLKNKWNIGFGYDVFGGNHEASLLGISKNDDTESSLRTIFEFEGFKKNDNEKDDLNQKTGSFIVGKISTDDIELSKYSSDKFSFDSLYLGYKLYNRSYVSNLKEESRQYYVVRLGINTDFSANDSYAYIGPTVSYDFDGDSYMAVGYGSYSNKNVSFETNFELYKGKIIYSSSGSQIDVDVEYSVISLFVTFSF